MADYGASYTDAELKKLEKKIGVVYKQAEADIKKKMKDFNAKYKAKEAKYLKDLADGKITQEQFDSWKKGQVFQGQQWQAKKDQLADTLLHANETATKIMNGQMTNVFAVNANFMSYSLEQGVGINFGFGLYDSATVSNLLKADQKLLPEWKINEKKDYTWNNKRVNRVVTQGIIQGERLDQIANRLTDRLVTQNKNKMMTFARTSMTCAQNAGREHSLNAAKDLGINVQKEWMCTLDGRTRDWHRMLDGQKQPLDKPFEVDGLKIRYPGDPEAVPGMVYNCRCTMVGDIVDYPATYDRYDNIDGKPIKGMTYQEWAKAKAATSANQTKLSNSVINGIDISNTWERRQEKFDFEIEDVINAQGFDGKPRVVSSEEFDKYVQEANDGNGFIAQRTYSAPNQETLDMYREQLYNGKWYVDCSNGGAHYGQGMYCAADYTGDLSEDIKQAMHYYGADTRKYNNVETFTLTRDAKIIDYNKLHDMQMDSETLTKKELENIFDKNKIENNEEKLYIMSRSGVYIEDTSTIRTWLGSLNKQQRDEINSRARSISKEASRKVESLQHMDIGAFGTLHGYDAINAEKGMHTVILNRTKVIFKGE